MGMSPQFGAVLERAVADLKITGASFAYWDGTTLHTAFAGLRNSVMGDPVTVDTVMHIGSITKVLNAVLMMQLVDDGVIRLEDPVVKHLPDLRVRDLRALERTTCVMLLNHTSGIDGDWLPEYGPDKERIVDSIRRCADLGQLFAPGEATSYCNMATVIAGYLVEQLRGKSWYTLVKERIYEPLGMRHALADVSDAPRFRCSIGDLTRADTGQSVQTTKPFLAPSFAPAGSTLMTSAADIVTFARALLEGGLNEHGNRILSAASAAQMAVPTTAFVSPAHQMGLGWMIAPRGILTHSGVGPGVQSVLFADPVGRRAMALLTSCDRGATLRSVITDPILESWTGIKKQIPQPDSSTLDPKPYVGVYESNLQRAEVSDDNGRLRLRLHWKIPLYETSELASAVSARSPAEMRALGNHRFDAPSVIPGAPRLEMKFVQPDTSGRMRFFAMGYRLLLRRG